MRVLWRTLAAVVAASVVGGTIVAFAKVRVCDEQLTAGGSVVSVCRHMEATDPPVIAGGLVLLIALGTFFTEISGFGISLKREVQEVRRTAQEAREEAAEAKFVSHDLEDRADALAEGLHEVITESQAERRPRDEGPREELDSLAREYNHIRSTMRASAERTDAMTSVAHRMVEHARTLSTFDVAGYLTASNAGRRLIAYTYVYAHPEPQWATPVAEAVLDEDKPFNQYWALLALEAMRPPISETLDRDLIRRLREHLPKLASDGSRYQLLARLLRTSR